MDRDEEVRQELIGENEKLRLEIEHLRQVYWELNERKEKIIKESGDLNGILKRKRSVEPNLNNKISR